MPITHCITLFLCSWKQRGYSEQCKTSHLFKAAHHYFSSPSCLGRLLSELDALKIESILCVNTEEREGRENSNNTLLSATPVLLKSRHQWNKEGEGKKKREKKRHEEVVVTLFVFNVEMLKKAVGALWLWWDEHIQYTMLDPSPRGVWHRNIKKYTSQLLQQLYGN